MTPHAYVTRWAVFDRDAPSPRPVLLLPSEAQAFEAAKNAPVPTTVYQSVQVLNACLTDQEAQPATAYDTFDGRMVLVF